MLHLLLSLACAPSQDHDGASSPSLYTGPIAAEAGSMEFDLAPFHLLGVAGEVLIGSTQQGEVIGATIEAQLSTASTDWSLGFSFNTPTGSAGFHSETLGWSGPGTFRTTFETDAFNGLLELPRGAGMWTGFATWTGGSPDGSGTVLLPVDGAFEVLSLTLEFAPCPYGDPLAPWQDVGGALSGSVGAPRLHGHGSLCGGETALLELAGGPPSARALLVVGVAPLELPVGDGLLIPSVDLVSAPLALDADGHLLQVFEWPHGVARGAELWVQAWIPDPAARQGWAASNGLRLTAPG